MTYNQNRLIISTQLIMAASQKGVSQGSVPSFQLPHESHIMLNIPLGTSVVSPDKAAAAAIVRRIRGLSRVTSPWPKCSVGICGLFIYENEFHNRIPLAEDPMGQTCVTRV